MSLTSLVYHPDLAPRFADYGIPVPLDMDRSAKIWAELKKHSPDLRHFSFDHLPKLEWSDVRLAHDLDFIARLIDPEFAINEIKFCYELERYKLTNGSKALSDMPHDVLIQCQGTLAAAELALAQKRAFFLGGGMHHAMSFAGRGFCLLNDIVLAIRKLQQDKRIQRAIVIDVDAHKGDGTSQITHNDASIVTMSMHMAKGWPLDGSLGPGPWDIPSDYDIPITESQNYLIQLDQFLSHVDLTSFDFAVVVLGADVWEHDTLTSASLIKLTSKEVLARDQMIEAALAKANLARLYVMGGGYGPNAHEPYVNFLLDQFVR